MCGGGGMLGRGHCCGAQRAGNTDEACLQFLWRCPGAQCQCLPDWRPPGSGRVGSWHVVRERKFRWGFFLVCCCFVGPFRGSKCLKGEKEWGKEWRLWPLRSPNSSACHRRQTPSQEACPNMQKEKPLRVAKCFVSVIYHYDVTN